MKIPLTSNNYVGRIDHDFGPKERFFTSFRAFKLLNVTSNQVDIGGILGGKQGQYQVALRGEVFIPDIEYPAVVRVMDLAGQKCAVRIERPPENTPVPKIGPLMCRAEK